MRQQFITLQREPGPTAPLGISSGAIAGGPVGMGIGAAAGLIDTGIGLITAEHNRKKNWEYQQKAMAKQYEYQMKLWEATGYGAQVDQMRRAGLNPALIYAKGGAGGQTATGTAQGPAEHPQPMPATGMGIQLGLQQAMIAAQIKNLEANTNKTNVEAQKTGGIDTKLGEANLEMLAQQTDNARWTYELLKLDKGIKEAELRIKEQTIDEQIKTIQAERQKLQAEANSAGARAKVDQATINTAIAMAGQQLTNAAIQGELMKAGITLTMQEVSQISNNMYNATQSMSLQERELKLKQELQQWTTDPSREAINNILKLLGVGLITMPEGTTPLYPNRTPGPIGFKK